MYRKLFNVLCLLLLSEVAVAQGVFAPDGAEWYHDMQFGCFHSTVTGDTVIQGIAAKKIRQQALVKEPWHTQGLQVYSLPDIYLYDGGDTVFAFNSIFSKFTPLYIFNVQEGDTLKLPILPAQGNGYPMVLSSDSTFSVIIDSVRMVQHDTSLLKTFYTRSIGSTGDNFRFNWGTEINGIYAEKVGAINSGFFPYCIASCTYLASDNAQMPGSLRCYSDTGYAIKFVAGDCDNGGVTSVRGVSGIDGTIKAYPNPADDKVSVRSVKPVEQIQIADMTGRIVLHTTDNKQEILTDKLPVGIYILKLFFNDQTVHTEKLVIQH